MELSTPNYPIQLPNLRREIIIIDYDFGRKKYHMKLYKTNRRDCYRVVIRNKIWRERIGWSKILENIRLNFVRIGGV